MTTATITPNTTHHARAVALMDAYRATLPRDPDLLECTTCGRDVPSDLEQVFDVVLCERCQGEEAGEQTVSIGRSSVRGGGEGQRTSW